MANVIFHGATISSVNFKAEESGVITRIHLTADLSKPVAEEFQWPDISEEVASCSFGTELNGERMIFLPNNTELKQHQFEIECKDVRGFSLSHVKEGDSHRTKLSFIARSSDVAAPAKLHQYLATVGKSDAQLKVTYAAQSQLEFNQQEDQETSEEEPTVSEDQDIPRGPELISHQAKVRTNRPRKDVQ